MLTKEEEIELVDAVLSGDQSAAENFYSTYKKVVFKVVHGFKQTGDDPEDLLQNIFLSLFEKDYRKIRLWRKEAKFSTYLTLITKNYLIDKTRKKRPQMIEVEDLDEIPDALTDSIEERDYTRKIYNAANLSIDALQTRDRDLAQRYFIKEETPDQIASALNISVNNFYVLFKRVKSRLSEHIKKDYPELFEDSS